jgi:hypothetical protein
MSFGKILAAAVCAVIVAISIWGWLQVPKLLKGDMFTALDPQYRDCAETRVHQGTDASCSWVLAHLTLAPPSHAKVLIHRGVWYNKTRRYREAIRDFDGVLALGLNKSDEFVLDALSDRSFAEKMIGEDVRAWADADRAAAAAPDNYLGYDARAFLHARAQQFALAAKDYDPLIRRSPDSTYAYNNRCWYRAIADDLTGALADCNRSLALDARNWAALDSRAFVYFKRSEYAKARDGYDAAVLAGANSTGTFYMRGLAKLRLGGTSGGLADIAQAKAAEPGVAERFAGYGVRP